MNTTTRIIRSYLELMSLQTFRERYEYLKLDGIPGSATFGTDRYLNQIFYRSPEWKQLRRKIIIRDHGCNLGVDGYEIDGPIIIHHMNPITVSDISENSSFLMNPDFLICTDLATHNAIHYGDVQQMLPNEMIIRQPNDTCPWRQ